MSTQEYDLMGKSQFLLLNPIRVRALYKADNLIGVQKVRISIRARRNDSFHLKAGYMTEALFLIKNLLTRTAGPYMTRMLIRTLPHNLKKKICIYFSIIFPFVWKLVFWVYSFHRTHRLTCSTIDALVRINI